jgi:hypothetical protein
MTRQEFLEALCAVLAEVKDKEGISAFPCFCGENKLVSKNDIIREGKAEKFLELAKMFVKEI